MVESSPFSARDALDRQLCAEATTSFFNNLDRGDYDRVVELLTFDAQWLRRGEALKGHAEVLAALHKRSPTLVSRHVLTNVEAVIAGANHAETRYGLLAFQTNLSSKASDHAKIAGPAAMLTCLDRLIRTNLGWKIYFKESHVTFVFDR